MRRAMLTSRPSGGGPFDFGNAVTGPGATAFASGNLALDLNTSSPSTGTITSLSWAANTATTITFVTGSLSGTTFTVRAVVDVATVASASPQSASVSLAVAAGDRLGLWVPATLAGCRTSGGSFQFGATAKPTPGAVITVGTTVTSGDATFIMHAYGS